MTRIHIPGFPRIGARRELKKALEAYWAGDIDQQELAATGLALREHHWRLQADAGVQQVSVGDFAWYDQILEWSATLGAVPERFNQPADSPVGLDTVFRMARGRAPSGEPAAACEMTKWFDTNYHYLVPELRSGQHFRLAREDLFEQVEEARAAGLDARPVIPGPLTWLWLGKGLPPEQRLALLDELVPVYEQILARLAEQGVTWVQIDEPILVLDLPTAWHDAFQQVYRSLADSGPRVLLATYFGALQDNLETALALPVDGFHLDLVRGPEQLEQVLPRLGERVLSAGVINGRNIWRTDLDRELARLAPVKDVLGDRLWLAPSCSLLHVPVDLAREDRLDPELYSWLAFAVQKLDELALLRAGLDRPEDTDVRQRLAERRDACRARDHSTRVHDRSVQQRMRTLAELPRQRPPYAERAQLQQRSLELPRFPTTTIGSFPQTKAIRKLRRDHKAGRISTAGYDAAIASEIQDCIRFQEQAGLDVLVHGEAERNDMVEYFGELLEGFAFTRFGWVQSYGSRCVKPPIIFGDVHRPGPMTVAWTRFAQSLTDRPVKGMLTGPVTILQWSFVRDDQARADTCRQIALALRDETLDLESAGTRIIQIDEPALREGLPLRRSDWTRYLEWAVDCFRLATAGVRDDTQIHTHMCYAEFNDIIDAIAALDADVITIETSRSHMELLEAFETFHYPNGIGPGVYDIHSPNVPSRDGIVRLIHRAAERIPAENLWVNPDCGLKTRDWPETRSALETLVAAARQLRQQYPN